MDITIFLAQIWGPVILAASLGLLVSRDHYMKIYRNIKQERLAVLVFASLAIVLGVIHVGAHNAWNGLTEVLISLFGWMLLVEGVVYTIRPQIAEKLSDWWLDRPSLFTAMSWITLVIGAYLSYVGFLM